MWEMFTFFAAGIIPLGLYVIYKFASFRLVVEELTALHIRIIGHLHLKSYALQFTVFMIPFLKIFQNIMIMKELMQSLINFQKYPALLVLYNC